MGAFNFNRNLEVEIEGKKYIIDTSSERVLKAVLDITNRSLELNKSLDENLTLEQLQEQIETTRNICIDFINNCLGENKVNELFSGMSIEYSDLVDLTQYLLNEITAFKNNKLNQFMKRS